MYIIYIYTHTHTHTHICMFVHEPILFVCHYDAVSSLHCTVSNARIQRDDYTGKDVYESGHNLISGTILTMVGGDLETHDNLSRMSPSLVQDSTLGLPTHKATILPTQL